MNDPNIKPEAGHSGKDQEKKLETEPIGKLFISLAIPSIISQIVNLLYSVVDRMYVGYIPETGTIALTALGVCVPIITLVSSFAQLVSSGAAPLASIQLGCGQKSRAEQILGNSFTAMLLMAVALTAVLLLFTAPILKVFGASDSTMPYAAAYLRIYACGNIFVLLTLGLNAFITAQGFSKISMITVLIGAIANIILDPVFIYLLDMGVSGAAYATILSQALSAVWAFRFFIKHIGILELKTECMKLRSRVILPALALGLAPFIMFATESVLVLTYNSSLLKYGGDMAVGMMTILSTLMQFLMLPAQGLAQGAQPIISYNYGAGNTSRVYSTVKRLVGSAFIITLIIYLVFMFASRLVILPFTPDPELIERTVWGIRIYFATGVLIGIQMSLQQTLIALGKAGTASFLSLLRKVFLLIPFIYIFPHVLDNQVFAVILAEPVADVIAVLTTILVFIFQFRKIGKEQGNGALKIGAARKGA